MAHRKRHRFLTGVLKDATSTVTATLSAKHKTARLYIPVVHATAHGVCDLPSEKHMATVISFGHGSRDAASPCIVALMDRLHGTKNACVALKCLFAIHSIVVKGSSILRDQLSLCPSFGGRNFLNLSKFRHSSDPDSLHIQRNNLIYEVIKLVDEDYRRVQLEMSLRVVELGDGIPDLSLGELAQLLDALKKLEDCTERLRLLFLNRKRNDALWELFRESKLKVMEMITREETRSLVKLGTIRRVGAVGPVQLWV